MAFTASKAWSWSVVNGPFASSFKMMYKDEVGKAVGRFRGLMEEVTDCVLTAVASATAVPEHCETSPGPIIGGADCELTKGLMAGGAISCLDSAEVITGATAFDVPPLRFFASLW